MTSALQHVKHLKFIDDLSCNEFEVFHLPAPLILQWPEEWRDDDIYRVLDMIPNDKLESFWLVSHTYRRLGARVLEQLIARQRKLEGFITPVEPEAEADIVQHRRSLRIYLDADTTFDDLTGQSLSIGPSTQRLMLQNPVNDWFKALVEHYDGQHDELISHLISKHQSL
ncbi:hypothetical protein G6011_09746 [Alternaria panax]|uniref:Uncharacterized protein n=1 Tax=Alternaria panax TaxID=48097 RepID=A0AAD4FB14_9PLEO|nr:hypothetical protein G6011_09746 [Alternaria panax]